LLERTVHDLRNPLAVVRATLEWLETELRDHEGVLDAVSDASIATDRLMRIVDDLHALSQLESGGPVPSQVVEVGVVFSAIVAAERERLIPRRVTIAAHCSPKLEGRGDEPLLRRSLEALVDACARRAAAGGVIELEARPSADATVGHEIEIEIGVAGLVANGPPTKSLENLASGGLGVYLAQRVFENHGGEVVLLPTASVPRVVARLPGFVSS
jgi:signal transduction histidine kinase